MSNKSILQEALEFITKEGEAVHGRSIGKVISFVKPDTGSCIGFTTEYNEFKFSMLMTLTIPFIFNALLMRETADKVGLASKYKETMKLLCNTHSIHLGDGKFFYYWNDIEFVPGESDLKIQAKIGPASSYLSLCSIFEVIIEPHPPNPENE